VATRCPKIVADKRKERLRKTAAKKQRQVSREQLILCEWTVLITNLPAKRMTLVEIWILYRVRWQIELVFKRWKSQGGLAESAGSCGWRWLCEFYAKLLGQVVQNWLTLLKGGPLSGYSPVKLQRRAQQAIPAIALALRCYAKRKQTVEPVFGIIKSVMGFRTFRLRGLTRVSLEWTLTTLAYNVKRLYALRSMAAG
jgi:hypothetical protein